MAKMQMRAERPANKQMRTAPVILRGVESPRFPSQVLGSAGKAERMRAQGKAMRRFVRENSLSLTMFGLFFVFLLGQSIAGHRNYNQEQRDHQESTVSYVVYLGSPNFVESVFENWESEFLQMGLYVLLTAFLFQKGSSESKDPEEGESVDADPREARGRKDVPGPVGRGGLGLRLYEHSLTLALLAIFVFSFALHVIGGAREYSSEQMEHGERGVSALEYLGTSRLWFESFQNWQSEFLAVGMLVVLSIFLRQRGSPESKPVAAPHAETGAS